MVLPLISALHLAAGGWQLRLHVSRRVGPSTYLANIVSQSRGPHVTIGHAVTLRLDRRSVCAPIRCGALRAHVPADVDVGGWFVTNTHRGPIAFRARRLDVAP